MSETLRVERSPWLGDNLDLMRERVADASVDLIYLDPPFGSGRDYALHRDSTPNDLDAISDTTFTDTWRWNEAAFTALTADLGTAPTAKLIAALAESRGRDPICAYLVAMAPRLIELRRSLAPTGSLYLHCDPSASHYLKLLLDTMFGYDCFRREIVWRSGWVSGFKTQTRNWVRNHDVILYYVADPKRFTFNVSERFKPHAKDYRRRGGGANPLGVAIDDVWDDPELYSPWIKSFSGEKRGYATQKPLALLERIIRVSSNVGDLVLDPFCGSGSTLIAAERLGRRWIGIDKSSVAIELTRRRLAELETLSLFTSESAAPGDESP